MGWHKPHYLIDQLQGGALIAVGFACIACEEGICALEYKLRKDVVGKVR